MIRVIVLLALAAVALSESIVLRNGEFKTVPLKENVYTSFEVYVRGNHRGVFVQATPYGCDSPITLFAANKANPTEKDYQWRSDHEAISRSTFLFVDEKDHQNATLYINARQTQGTTCLMHIVAHIEHVQTLLQLYEGVPAYGMFRPKRHEAEQHHHFFEFKLKNSSAFQFEEISFLATNIEGRRGRDDVILQTFASTSNSRPIPGRHEWAGLSTARGDSFLSISSKDPKFKIPATYWLGVRLVSPQEVHGQERIFYSVVAHTLTKTSNATLDPPILLLDGQGQSAFAPANHYAYFTAYIDKARVGRDVRVVVRTEFGNVKLFASTKTVRPDEKNYEWEGKPVRENELEATIKVDKPNFLYVGILSDADTEVLSTYDVHFFRGE